MGATISTETTQPEPYGQTGTFSDKTGSQNLSTNYETSTLPVPFQDEFVRQKLNECNSDSVLQVFFDNEIDQTAFLLLSEVDLKTLLPGKLGPIKKIWELIQRLNNKKTDVDTLQSNELIHVAGATQSDTVNNRDEIYRPLQAPQFSLNFHFINCNQIEQSQNLFRSAHQDETGGGEERPERRDIVSDKRIERRPFQRNCDQPNTTETRAVRSEQSNLGETFKKEKRITSAQSTSGVKKKNPSISKKPSTLPIHAYKNDFLRLVEENSVVIVIAETGSGKSTQMPQYLANANYKKKIICTQPRRLAAKSLATRVAYEFGSKLGEEVGYRVRFDNCTENTTKISYVTEGVLVHELSMDATASNYSVIIIDEAHERNLNTDVLLGCLKKAIALRSDLKVVISSATVEADKFSKYFNGAPVLDVPGRSFKVNIEYSDEPDPDHLNGVVSKVCDIHRSNRLGDILVFLPGQDEIEYAVETITREISSKKNPLVDARVLPLYSKLPSEQQSLIFERAPANTRKIILATNIAETSLTIDGIVFVVDSGLVKQAEYKADGGLECTTLTTVSITKAQAKQRSGRAGRTQEGVAYRLYSKETYNEMKESPKPEIFRGNLELVVLLLYSMGIKNILEFDFIDSPPRDALLAAIERLEEFGAVIGTESRNEYTLTRVGRQMSSFPIEPYLSKVLIASANFGCSEEMLTIIALLSAQFDKLFVRPKDKYLEADKAKKSFHCKEGDHITLLNVYNQWLLNENRSKVWCTENFLDWRTLDEVYEIRCQLSAMLDEKKIIRKSCRGDMVKVQMAIVSGSFRKVAWKVKGSTYKTYSSSAHDRVRIHPSSSLFSTCPPVVIYNSIIKTTKAYMSQVLKIKDEYIQECAGKFYEKIKIQ